MRLMTISEKGLGLIKEFEGLQLKAYKCPAGKWTVGYGHTSGVTATMCITEAEAERMLRDDLAPVERLLNRMKVNFRQEQFDALCSFIFNVGAANFNASTAKKRILGGQSDQAIVAALKLWNKATVNGKKVVLAGLVKRREAEGRMFMGEDKR